MLTILMGRAKTGKSEQVLRRIGELGDSSRQILLVPEHASHQAEVDLCRACGDTASRHAEVLSFRRLCDRVLTITGGAAQVTLDAGGKLLTLQKALGEVAPLLKVYRRPSQKASFYSSCWTSSTSCAATTCPQSCWRARHGKSRAPPGTSCWT